MLKEPIIIISLTVLFTMAIGTCFVKTVFEMLEMLWNDNDRKHNLQTRVIHGGHEPEKH